jgi:hypothetical protein
MRNNQQKETAQITRTIVASPQTQISIISRAAAQMVKQAANASPESSFLHMFLAHAALQKANPEQHTLLYT